jgi:DNA polymerase elongation subunit (family B)
MIWIDTECYRDYWLFSAMREDGEIVHIEQYEGKPLDAKLLRGVLGKYTSISFNGLSYDLPLIAAALSGYDCAQLKKLSDRIIKSKSPAWQICRDGGINVPAWDHIDLIDVAPGQSSLKMYGARMGAPKLQDLPIDPDASIAPEQRETLRRYCENDLRTTRSLYERLKGQITLRESMSKQYGLDLRSKSDAQIAEAVIKSELSAVTGETYVTPALRDDYSFHYRDPGFLRFQTDTLREVKRVALSTPFTLGLNGAVKLPDELKRKIRIGNADYQMGIGGLHSCEQSQYVTASVTHIIADYDVASYYPSIILQQKLFPGSMGEPFLEIYRSIVNRRLDAKRAGDKVTADTLKICVNGSFGKLGSKWSALYAPDLMIQVTLSGQLALLMLIERMELAEITVISANTDGIVLHYPRDRQRIVDEITWDWMLTTSYELERTEYDVLASRDVNNYVAVKPNGKTKGKGVFAEPGLSKNPEEPIVYRAVAQHLADTTPIEETINDCKDILQFVIARKVTGGAKWRDCYLGKTVRYYKSTQVGNDECIHYATNSNRVPKSCGCRPLMDVPESFPDDVDFAYYHAAARQLLKDVGYA